MKNNLCEKPKMLIVDGSSVLTTCFYAALPNEIKYAKTDEEKEQYYYKVLQSSNGTYTNGILGMSRILSNIVAEGDFRYIVTVFDKTRDTFRRKLYAEYKAQRGKSPEPLKEQFITMETILKESGFPVFMSDEYEADDLAGSIAEKFKDEYQISLLTKDRDYLQLVDDANNVKCLIMSDYEKAEEFRAKYGLPTPEEKYLKAIMVFDAEAVKGEKGVEPSQIVDLKAIEGDASDNIPGVKGVSSASVPLLNKYLTVEDLYETIHSVQNNAKETKELVSMWKDQLGIKRSPINALLAGEESCLLSKELATIVRNIPIPDFSANSVDHLNTEAFNNWMDKLEIRNISLSLEKPSIFDENGEAYFDFTNRNPFECEVYFEPEFDKSYAEAELQEKESVPSTNNKLFDEIHSKMDQLKSNIDQLESATEIFALNKLFEEANDLLVRLFDLNYNRIKKA